MHDVDSRDEDYDPEHGPRAAVLALQLSGPGGVIDPDEARMRVLTEAIRNHTGGRISLDPTVGCCWDIDRLDLRREAVEPEARYGSTEAARSILLSA